MALNQDDFTSVSEQLEKGMASSELMIALEVDLGPCSPEATVNGSKRVTLQRIGTGCAAVIFGKDGCGTIT